VIRCHGSQIFKRNAFTYRVMTFSYHSLSKHMMLLLSEILRITLPFGKFEECSVRLTAKSATSSRGPVILSIRMIKVLLICYYANHKEVGVGSRGCPAS